MTNMIDLCGYIFRRDSNGNLNRDLSFKEYGEILDFYSTSIYAGGKFWGEEILSSENDSLNIYRNREKNKAKELLQLIHRYTPTFGKSGSLLDIGCGIGAFLNILSDTNLALTGYDISKLAPKASVKFWGDKGFDLIQCELSEKLLNIEFISKWNYIVCFDFLEHFKNDILLLHKFRGALANSGILYLEVPIFDTTNLETLQYEEFLFPEHHIHLYCVEGLESMIKNTDLSILKKIRIRNNKKILYILEK